MMTLHEERLYRELIQRFRRRPVDDRDPIIILLQAGLDREKAVECLSALYLLDDEEEVSYDRGPSTLEGWEVRTRIELNQLIQEQDQQTRLIR